MPRIAPILKDLDCRNAKPIINKKSGLPAPKMLSDGFCPGLKLHVSLPAGKNQTMQKTWRFQFKDNQGKYRSTDLGKYPSLSLDQARKTAEIIRLKLVGQDNILLPDTCSFGVVAEDFMAWKKKYHKSAAATVKKDRLILENYILPKIGTKDINEVNREVCSEVILFIDSKSNSLAVKGKQLLDGICQYAVRERKKKESVDLQKIIRAEKAKPFEMPSDIQAEYRKCEEMTSEIMRIAMQLQHHIFLRSGSLISHLDEDTKEVFGSKWCEVDWEKQLWIIPGERMKMGSPHATPFTTQVFKLLTRLNELTGESEYMFPTQLGKNKNKIPMVRDTLSKAFREKGIAYHPHKCRTIAGDWLKRNGANYLYVELQLSHQIPLGLAASTDVQKAYEHSPHLYYLDERREMLQKWSDFLELQN